MIVNCRRHQKRSFASSGIIKSATDVAQQVAGTKKIILFGATKGGDRPINQEHPGKTKPMGTTNKRVSNVSRRPVPQ